MDDQQGLVGDVSLIRHQMLLPASLRIHIPGRATCADDQKSASSISVLFRALKIARVGEESHRRHNEFRWGRPRRTEYLF